MAQDIKYVIALVRDGRTTRFDTINPVSSTDINKARQFSSAGAAHEALQMLQSYWKEHGVIIPVRTTIKIVETTTLEGISL